MEALGDRITLNGYVSGKDKTAIFDRADVLLLPSYHEGMPLVILEALANGCAIVSTRVGATPEILTDSHACWVDIANSVQIAEAVKKLAEDEAFLAQMQENNQKMAESFTIEANIKSLCKIYEEK